MVERHLMELVAEIGPANGDLQYALDVVNAVKECGFHSVKGQIYDRDKLVTKTAKTYAQDLQVPETQYEDFANTLTYDQWALVYTEARRINIPMFFSVFDFDAVAFCQTLGVERYKIASGDITYQQLIERVTATGKHIILSTGASTYDECVRGANWAWNSKGVTLLACSLSYPTRKQDAHLTRMKSLWNVDKQMNLTAHLEFLTTKWSSKNIFLILITISQISSIFGKNQA